MNSSFPKKNVFAKPQVEGKAANVDPQAYWRIASWFPDLGEEKQQQLRIYHGELLKFTSRVNLISKNTEREADEAHVADCVMAGKIILAQKFPKKIFDIGSGNGAPGIILAIMDPSRDLVLVESDSRKCEFLKHVVAVLKLKNVIVSNARFETIGPNEVTCAVSRGFASISKTLLSCNKIFGKGGIFVHLKGSSWATEIGDIPSQLISQWSPQLLGEYSLPSSQARRAVVVTQKLI